MKQHADEKSDDSDESNSGYSLITLAASIVISFAVGAGAGFIFGHNAGKNTNASALNEAVTKQTNAELETSRYLSEIDHAKSQLLLTQADMEQIASKSNQVSEQLRTTSEQLGDANSRTKAAEIDLVALKNENTTLKADLAKAAAQLFTVGESLKKAEADQRARAEIKAKVVDAAKARREKASDLALVQLNEHLLTADLKDKFKVNKALGILGTLCDAYTKNQKPKSEDLIASAQVYQECAILVRIGGEYIPKDSDLSLMEAWVKYLSDKLIRKSGTGILNKETSIAKRRM